MINMFPVRHFLIDKRTIIYITTMRPCARLYKNVVVKDFFLHHKKNVGWDDDDRIEKLN